MWHGWLSFSHDDAPTPDNNNFFRPFYEKQHTWLNSISAFKMHIPRRSIISEKIIDYETYR
jgi:NADH:ubiquinone oxidoreductase subunit